jgi:hypothetical protein
MHIHSSIRELGFCFLRTFLVLLYLLNVVLILRKLQVFRFYILL